MFKKFLNFINFFSGNSFFEQRENELRKNEQKDNLKKIFSSWASYASFEEWKQLFEDIEKEDFIECKKEVLGNNNLFNVIYNKDGKNKINFLLQNCKRFDIDPNEKNVISSNAKEHSQWDNPPLISYIVNEYMELTKFFLDKAKELNIIINKNIKDRGLKTPFFLAVKMAYTPLSLLKKLITLQNYMSKDYHKFSPAMLACVMNRVDVLKLILQYLAKELNLGKLDFNNLPFIQKIALKDFINQQHPVTGKSLAHFAITPRNKYCCMENTSTINSFLASVGIDSRRDRNFRINCKFILQPTHLVRKSLVQTIKLSINNNYNPYIVNPALIDALCLQDIKKQYLRNELPSVEFTELNFNDEFVLKNSLVVTKESEEQLLLKKDSGIFNKLFCLKERDFSKEDKESPLKSVEYAGESLESSIFSKTLEMLTFLLDVLEIDINLKDNNNLTVLDYALDLLKVTTTLNHKKNVEFKDNFKDNFIDNFKDSSKGFNNIFSKQENYSKDVEIYKEIVYMLKAKRESNTLTKKSVHIKDENDIKNQEKQRLTTIKV